MTIQRKLRKVVGSKRGFTFGELAVALVIFSLISSTLVLGLAKQNRFRRRSEYAAIAQILARNEIEALRAAGPANADSYVGSRQANSAGATDAGGVFEIEVAADTLCVGGARTSDDVNVVIASSCANNRNAIVRYTIGISYPTGIGRDTVRYQMDLSERGRFGDARATY